METVGIVGGLGVAATVDYYRRIVAACQARGVVPELVFNHADVRHGQALVEAGRLDALAEYLAGFIAQLRRAGASAAVLPAAGQAPAAFARYESTAILFHWLMFVLVAVAYATIELRGFAERGTAARMINPMAGPGVIDVPSEQVEMIKDQSDMDGPLVDYKKKGNNKNLSLMPYDLIIK